MELKHGEIYVTRDGNKFVYISCINDYEAVGEYGCEDGTDVTSIWSPFTGKFMCNVTQENHPYDLVMTAEDWMNHA